MLSYASESSVGKVIHVGTRWLQLLLLFGLLFSSWINAARLGHLGLIESIRVQSVGTYGSGDNALSAEVIVVFKNKPGHAFGFQLRNDSQRHAKRAMLDLLRDAFRYNLPVDITYDQTKGKKAGVIVQVTLSR